MKCNLTFGECLSILLNTFKLKCSNLAKGINVDSSLIYKWLRNERVPSYNSTHVELIANHLVKNVTNSFQREAIAEMFACYGIEVSDINDIDNMMKNSTKLLLEAQGYSIELHNKRKRQQKQSLTGVSNIEGLIKSIDTQSNTSNNGKSDNQLKDYNPVLCEHLFCGCDNIDIIKGHVEVLYSALKLLKSIPNKPYSDNNEILITLNSDMNLLPSFTDFNTKWKHTLYDVLRNGWKAIFLFKLDNNVSRTIKFIEDMQFLLTTGNFSIYYYKQNNDIANINELYIVPQTGALFCFSSYLRNQVDSAFLFHAKGSIDALSAHFFQFFYSTKLLLKSYPSQKTSEFQHAFVEAEETLGDKYIFKAGLSTITMPLYLYEKYLNLSYKTSQEISYRVFLHKRRLDAFEAQVKYYKFKDICLIEQIEKLVNEQKYSFDEYYILEDNTPQNIDIICHLENLINMLQRYDNYEIAFVNEKYFQHISKICWMVKGDCSVLIETLNSKSNGMLNNDSYSSEINLTITETGIVSAFRDYFLINWNDIPDQNKNKKTNIEWLRSLVRKAKRNQAIVV